MKKRPRELTFLALFLGALAIGIPAQIMYLYEHTPWEVGAILAKLSPMNWIIVLTAPLVARLIWIANPAAKFAVPVFGMMVVYNNWLVAEIGTDFPRDFVLTSTGVFLASLGAVFIKDVRFILAHPEKRWWLTPRRKSAELPIRVCFFNKKGKEAMSSQEFYSRTHDLSEGGAFVNLDKDDIALMTDDTLSNLKNGTQCFVTITLKDLCYFQCRAEIVRKSAGNTGNYPAGVGIQFLGLTWNEKKMLTEYLAKAPEAVLKKAAAMAA